MSFIKGSPCSLFPLFIFFLFNRIKLAQTLFFFLYAFPHLFPISFESVRCGMFSETFIYLISTIHENTGIYICILFL